MRRWFEGGTDRGGIDRADEAVGLGESNRRLSLLGRTFLVNARVGIMLWSCIVFSSLFAAVNSDASSGTALTLWCGLLVPFLKGVTLCMLRAIMPCSLALHPFGSLVGLGFFLHLFVRRMCVVGLLSVLRSSGLRFTRQLLELI